MDGLGGVKNTLDKSYIYMCCMPLTQTVLVFLQVITIGRHVKGYHYIIANLVSPSVIRV